MKRIHYIMTFLGLLITIIVMADSSRLYTSDKLSSSLINCVTQDKYGFMWIGTEYGLSKFDGYKFTNYLHNNKDTTSIADNIIKVRDNILLNLTNYKLVTDRDHYLSLLGNRIIKQLSEDSTMTAERRKSYIALITAALKG